MSFIKNYSGQILLALMGLWSIAGFMPNLVYGVGPTAGTFGDSFGAATSFFSAISFFAAMMALMMQIEESKESGERQLKQEQLELKQIELQTEQARIALRTSELQESIRKDGQKQLAIQILHKAYFDALNYRRALEEVAKALTNSALASELPNATDRLNIAESELLSNSLSLSFVFGDEMVNGINMLFGVLAKHRNKPAQVLDKDVFKNLQVALVACRDELVKLWRSLDESVPRNADKVSSQ